MLVLTRKKGEEIVIDGGKIVVTFLGVNDKNQLRIGVKAPKDVDVHRREVFERIKAGVKHPKHK